MGFKVPNASVLGGVKQHFQSFGLPFHHNPHEDHDKGGAARLSRWVVERYVLRTQASFNKVFIGLSYMFR